MGKGPSHSKVHVSREEMAGSIEMAFGVWDAVGPSNDVFRWGSASPMVSDNFGGDFLSIEKHWHCVHPSVHRAAHHTCCPPAKDAEAIRRLGVGFAIKRSLVRFPVGATLCNDCGQVDFFGDDAVFYRITLISCYSSTDCCCCCYIVGC